jgi:PIN domain nuclease of toxin-antitoxin system
VGRSEVKLLLDTHVLIWLAEGLSELPKSSCDLIDQAAQENGLAVSPISFWEVAMLESRRRISLSQPVQRWRQTVLDTSGIVEAALSGEVAIEAVHLPGTLHGDPADRMLVATARLNGWRFATRDSDILAYGASGHLSSVRV